jgi:hypothetical protein
LFDNILKYFLIYNPVLVSHQQAASSNLPTPYPHSAINYH